MERTLLIEIPPLGSSPSRPRKVFISPVNLTANGPAHLGHVGGPFIRMDILGRHLARAGHDVRSALTTDHFENHVAARANALGRDPDALARENCASIRAAMEALDIHFDDFPDTGDPQVLEQFQEVADRLMEALRDSGRMATCDEMLPIDDALPADGKHEDRFAIGAWFRGTCPGCSRPVGSFLCEACGAHFAPAEAGDPASSRGGIVTWEPTRTAYLDLAPPLDLEACWTRMAVEQRFVEVARLFMAAERPRIRLTVPAARGLAWRSPEVVDRQTLFSYSALLYAHHLLCGERAMSDDWREHPFGAESETVLLSATGIDNTIPMLAGLTGCALAQQAHRPFDRVYFNHFLRLEGEKFSTSRNHVIWALDVQRIDGLNVDLLRTYLGRICPEDSETDFRIGDFVAFHNAALDAIRECTAQSAALLTHEAGVPRSICRQAAESIASLYFEQAQALSTEGPRVASAVEPMMRLTNPDWWPTDAEEAHAWLAAFALLAAPIMPRHARAIWQWLGHPGRPEASRLHEPSIPTGAPAPTMPGRHLDESVMRAELGIRVSDTAQVPA